VHQPVHQAAVEEGCTPSPPSLAEEAPDTLGPERPEEIRGTGAALELSATGLSGAPAPLRVPALHHQDPGPGRLHLPAPLRRTPGAGEDPDRRLPLPERPEAGAQASIQVQQDPRRRHPGHHVAPHGEEGVVHPSRPGSHQDPVHPGPQTVDGGGGLRPGELHPDAGGGGNPPIQ
jgi:hypothetical protein